MSNFRNTADLLDGILRRCGEMTASQGTSPRQTSALLYLNQVHSTIVSGGNELNIDVDEPWVWARAHRPIVLQVNPSITAGTVSLTQGSVSGTFSTAPQLFGANVSLQDWHLRPQGSPEIYVISNHTAGQTSFQLDAAFPQTTNSALSFTAMQLDYDVVTSYLLVDTTNQKLDYVSNSVSLAVNTATLTAGTYTPAGLATQVATALNAVADGNTYTCTYDTIQRLFSITSNLGGTNPVFKPQGAGTNAYRSGWNLLGFDYTNYTTAATQVSVYPVSSIVRLSQPGRIYYGQTLFGQQDGIIAALDPVAFDKQYPLSELASGSPSCFTLIREKRDGTFRIRLNRFLPPSQTMRIEFEHVPYAKDLFNNTASIPIFPRRFNRILEYGASYYLSLDKRDARADTYLGIAQKALQAMMKENRRELERTGRNLGNVIARLDMMPSKRFRRANYYGYDVL